MCGASHLGLQISLALYPITFSIGSKMNTTDTNGEDKVTHTNIRRRTRGLENMLSLNPPTFVNELVVIVLSGLAGAALVAAAFYSLATAAP